MLLVCSSLMTAIFISQLFFVLSVYLYIIIKNKYKKRFDSRSIDSNKGGKGKIPQEDRFIQYWTSMQEDESLTPYYTRNILRTKTPKGFIM